MAPRRAVVYSPLGEILDKNGRFSIGKKIGEGAQASVHIVVDSDGNENGKWVAKIAPLPTTEKGKRRIEMTNNANSIYNESTKYTYSLMANLRGTMVPQIPLKVKGLSAYTDNGRKYSVSDHRKSISAPN